MSTPSEATHKVSKARLRLMLREPYLAAAVARYPMGPAASAALCPTFATDGYRILYSPAFVMDRDQDDLVFVIAHEVLHCLLGHMDRRGLRDPERWNIAADLAVNGALVEFGFVAPEDALMDWRSRGKTAEEIYEGLKTDGPGDAASRTPGRGASGHVIRGRSFDVHLDPSQPGAHPGEAADGRARMAEIPSPLERRRLRKQLISELLRNDRVPGNVKGRLLEEVRRASEPEVDWRTLVAHFVTALRRDDYRTFPFNKKHIWRGLFLPSCGVPTPRHLVVAVDTSGSISEENLSRFLTEVDQLRVVTRCRLTVIEFDAEIQKVTDLEETDRPTLSQDGSYAFQGRGGTDINSPFQWVQSRMEAGEAPPDAMMVATDGFGPMPPSAPAFPVLWLAPHGTLEHFPFGRVVRLAS